MRDCPCGYKACPRVFSADVLESVHVATERQNVVGADPSRPVERQEERRGDVQCLRDLGPLREIVDRCLFETSHAMRVAAWHQSARSEDASSVPEALL